tara:strand:- start:2789 stop:3100 length:312 start_codon:yes stop_codon:yes gene_type:complete
MYFVRTRTKRDTELPYGFIDTYEAKTKSEAMQVAVMRYLDNFADTGEFGQRFLELYKNYKANKTGIVSELFTFFQQNESKVFAGEHVDKTFSITLESKKRNEG